MLAETSSDTGQVAGPLPARRKERRRQGFRRSALWLLMVLAGTVFAAETVIMLVLNAMPPLPYIGEALVDATVLVLILFPVFYWVVFRPLTVALSERAVAERLARQRFDALEKAHRETESAQAHLLKSEKMASIGQLAAGIAHEINNPVGFVASNLGSLRKYVDQLLGLLDSYADAEKELADDSPARERIAAARELADIDYLREDLADLLSESQAGIERVRRIAQDVKRLSHPGDGECKPADLNACIESTLTVVWNELKYKAEVVRELGPVPPVRCMIDQISQVAVNLLVNAAQAIDSRGVITVSTRQDGEFAVLEVSDTGKGMSAEVQQRVFEPFFTTKPVGEGTGLGLSIASKIIHNHGGEMSVRSEQGAGTTLVVRLPLRGPPTPA